MGRVWPLTGRAEELGLIARSARRAGRPAGVVLAGAAGVGKTRLAREAMAAAARQGAVTRWAVGTASARSLPLGAFAPLLGDVGPDPIQLLRRATTALLAGAGRAGVVLGVDDAHRLDDVSALLVHQLVVRRAATVVVTVRTGESSPDAVTALWKDGHLDRLEVQPLSELEVGILVEAVLGGPVESHTLHRLWSVTQGNVLFLRHLVDGELEAGRLREVGGVWQWPGHPSVAPRLAELVDARIGQLSGPLRAVVATLALSEPLGVDLLGALTDPAAVEEAEQRALVLVEQDGQRLQVRLAHPLYGEVQRTRISTVTGRRLRGNLARALAATGSRRRDDTLRRAILALDSDLPPDPHLFTSAARDAQLLLDLPLTERMSLAACAAGGGFESRLTLAYALSFQGRGRDAAAELDTAARLAVGDADRGEATIPRVGNLFWTLRRPADAEALLADAEAAVVDDGVRLVLTAMRSTLDAYHGRPVRAERAAAEVLAACDALDQAVIFATWGLALARGVRGRAGLDEALARAEAAASRSWKASYLRIGLAHTELVAHRLAGRVREADRAAHRFSELTRDLLGPVRPISSVLLGVAAVLQGRVRAGARLLTEARAGLGSDPNGWTFVCLLSLAPALAMLGDTPAARQALAAIEAERHPAFAFHEPDVVLARAWVAAAEGALSEAVRLAREAAARAAALDAPAMELDALHTAVRLGDPAPAPRIVELAAGMDGPLAPAAAAHSAALAAGDGDGLDAAAARLVEIGTLLPAADAAAQAAVAHQHRGRRGAAFASTARAQTLAAACEGARTPALAAVTQPLPLTAREREIVTLAAAGLSNRDIADRLTVSVRTVEGHVYRACGKLGVSHRDELRGILQGRRAAR